VTQINPAGKDDPAKTILIPQSRAKRIPIRANPVKTIRVKARRGKEGLGRAIPAKVILVNPIPDRETLTRVVKANRSDNRALLRLLGF
jgi:hypothetical protein